MSGLPPTMRADYRRGIELTLRRGGLLIGVWYINPALDPGYEGPPFPFSVADLTALFAEGYEIVEDYVPDVAFAGREGRERVRVLRRVTLPSASSQKLDLGRDGYAPELAVD